MSKNIVVLTGAGISAESGIKTFRDAGGLWEGHDVMEVATPEGWHKNPSLVLEFYNARRRQLTDVSPNAGHTALVALAAHHQVNIITQNVDDLHERAGSVNVLHLHGELLKSRSVNNSKVIFDCKEDIHMGDLAPNGGQLRPHIVWFGEEVPMIEKAAEIASKADLLIIVGTSLQVYPAAGLVSYAPSFVPIIYVDPHASIPANISKNRVRLITDTAAQALPDLVAELIL